MADARAHDGRIAASELEVWIGAEPPITNARSQLPCWLTDADSGEKVAHGRALLLALAPRVPGPVKLLRVHGRLYR